MVWSSPIIIPLQIHFVVALDIAVLVDSDNIHAYFSLSHLRFISGQTLAKVLDFFGRNKSAPANICLSLPTGAGKTRVASEVIKAMILSRPKDSPKRVLWIAPAIELLDQAQREIERLIRSCHLIGKIRIPSQRALAEQKIEEDWDIHFLTIHTASKQVKAQILPNDYFLIVQDECHWGVAEETKMFPELMEYFENQSWLGLSATPFKASKRQTEYLKSFYRAIETVSFKEVKETRDSIGRSVLAQPIPIACDTGFRVRVDNSKDVALDFDDKVLANFDVPSRNKFVVDKWNPALGKTLVFAISIRHANNLARLFSKTHSKASLQILHSEEIPADIPVFMRPKEKKFVELEQLAIQRAFRSGQIDILISVEKCIQGIDLPNIETLFMSRPTRSRVKYQQMLGRGLRGPAVGGTEHVKVFDFWDAVTIDGLLMRQRAENEGFHTFEEDVEEPTRRPRPIHHEKESKPGRRWRSGRAGTLERELSGLPGWYVVEGGRQSQVKDIGRAIERRLDEGEIDERDKVRFLLS